MVDGSTADLSLDVRLDRRLKRRAISNQMCKNFCHKTLKNDKLNELDSDYQKLFYKSRKFVDIRDRIVEAKPLNLVYSYDDCGISRCNTMDDEKFDDPIYKMFLQHLSVEDKAYKLEIPSVNEKKVYVIYEEKENSSSKNDQSSERTTRILKSASDKGEIQSLVPLFEEECTNSMSHGVNVNSGTMHNVGLSSAENIFGSDFDLDIVQEDYKIFLTNFRYDGGRLIFSPVNGRPVVYEDNERPSDSEVMIVDTVPCKRSIGREYLHSTMDVDSGNFLQSPGICRSSNFRERLMEVLEKPYDQREYDFFLKEISCCRLQVRYRELRNRALKPYTLESHGKSYLLLYNALAMKIQSVQYDRPRTLNLLRGFFFWLQNLSHDDKFQPWRDPACLAVLPRS